MLIGGISSFMLLLYRKFWELDTSTTHQEQQARSSRIIVTGAIAVVLNISLVLLSLMAKSNDFTFYIPFTNLVFS